MAKTLNTIESFRFFLPKIWNNQCDLRFSFNVFDTIVIEHESISTWLFTSKEGLVKSKSKRRKGSLVEVVEHYERICNNYELQIPSMVFFGRTSEFHSVRSKEQFTALLHDKSQDTIIILLPNAAMKSRALVKVTYERPRSAISSSSGFLDTSKLKVKTYLPAKPISDDNTGFANIAFLDSKNQMYNNVARDTIIKFVREIEHKCANQIDWLSAYFYISIDETSNLINSPSNYTLWLHHVEAIAMTKKAQDKLSEQENSSCISSRLSILDSSTKSRAAYLKPWDICMGDFCPFSFDNNSLDIEGDLFELGFHAVGNDVKLEAKKAIHRHRRVEESGGINCDEEEDSGYTNMENLTCQRVPIKERTVMIKSILLAREEMNLLDDIDKRFVQSSIAAYRSIGEEENKLQMKIEIESLWPTQIARWWLSEGRQFLPAIPKVGKPPVATNKSRLHGNEDKILTNDNADRNKWFCWYYSQAKVCENCYLSYQQLELYRNSQHKKLQHQAKLESEEANLTPEEKKLRDRKIEQRIFSQRKLATRLSKCKPKEHNSSDVGLPIPKLVNKNISNELLPPVPWKHTTYNNFENKTSITSHILSRSATKLRLDSQQIQDSDPIVSDWELMRKKTQLKPITFQRKSALKKNAPKTVDATNYNAHRLLHSWQRDLDKLKRSNLCNENVSLDNGFNTEEGQHNLGRSQHTFESSRKSSWRDVILEEENENADDSDDEFYRDDGLGWNPFVLNVNDS